MALANRDEQLKFLINLMEQERDEDGNFITDKERAEKDLYCLWYSFDSSLRHLEKTEKNTKRIIKTELMEFSKSNKRLEDTLKDMIIKNDLCIDDVQFLTGVICQENKNLDYECTGFDLMEIFKMIKDNKKYRTQKRDFLIDELDYFLYTNKIDNDTRLGHTIISIFEELFPTFHYNECINDDD